MSRGYDGDLYAKVPIGVCSLIRPLTPNAKLAFWAIVTAPNGWRHPGLYQAGPGYLADETGTDLEAAHAVLDEIERAGLATVDRDARLVYVPGWAGLRSVDNPNTVITVARDLRSLPASPVVSAYAAEIEGQLAGKSWKLPTEFATAGALFRHHLRAAGTVPATVPPTVPATVAPTVPPTVGLTGLDHDHDSIMIRLDEDEGEGAGAAPETGPDSPPVSIKETQDARKPDATTATPTPEIRWNVTEDTRQFAEDLVAPHGLTVSEWMRAGGHGTDFKPGHMTTLKAEFKNRPVDPAEALKRETAARNREWREVRALFERDYIGNPEMEVAAWAAAHPGAEKYLTALRGALGSMRATVRHAGVAS